MRKDNEYAVRTVPSMTRTNYLRRDNKQEREVRNTTTLCHFYIAIVRVADPIRTGLCIQEELAHLIDILEFNGLSARQASKYRCGSKELEGISIKL